MMRHRIIVTGAAIILIQFLWKGTIVWHSYFWQEDIRYFGRGYHGGMAISQLFTVDAGHLYPGVDVVSGLLAHFAPFNYTIAGLIILLSQAAGAAAVLRMLVALFGERPAILLPFVFYVACPLTAEALGWWSAGIELLPFQIGMAMAIASHVRYIRQGRSSQLASSSLWIVFAMLFYLKAAAIPVILLWLTAAFLVPERGHIFAALGATFRRHRLVWQVYGGILLGYIVIYFISPRTANTGFTTQSGAVSVVKSGWNLLNDTIVPGALGGPWHWTGNQGGADEFAHPSSVLQVIAWAILIGLMLVSLLYRRHAGRAWLLLLAYVIVVDLLPTVAGRSNALAVLSTEPRYVTDLVPMIALCVTLAMLPLAGEEDAYYRPLPAGSKQIAIVLAGAIVVGSIVTVNDYNRQNGGSLRKAFLGNMTDSLSSAPPGTVILDGRFPDPIMTPLFGRPLDMVSWEMAPYVARLTDHGLTFTEHPQGTIDHLMEFDTAGVLRDSTVVGESPAAATTSDHCYPSSKGQAVLQLPKTTQTWNWVIQVAYLSPQFGTMQVGFGGKTLPLIIQSGLHNGYVTLPTVASGSTVTLTLPNPHLCVSKVTIGLPQPVFGQPLAP